MTPPPTAAAFVVASYVAASLATIALLQVLRPVIRVRMLVPTLSAAACASAVTAVIGAASGVARVEFLLGVCAFTLPVLVLLEATAIASGADRLVRWVLTLGWGGVVFPAAIIVPALLVATCAEAGCGFVDFGGAIGLVVSSSAFVVLAWAPTGEHWAGEVPRLRALFAVLGFWAAWALWLATLELAWDVYIPRIMFTALVGPLAAAVGWLVTDRLRDRDRPVVRSLGFGLLAGCAATMPGAVSVGMPWTIVVGLIAGAVASAIHDFGPFEAAGPAPRWALSILAATGVGFLAPPIAGDTIGILFRASVGVLQTHALVFGTVAIGALVISAPVWILLRRHAASRVDQQPT